MKASTTTAVVSVRLTLKIKLRTCFDSEENYCSLYILRAGTRIEPDGRIVFSQKRCRFFAIGRYGIIEHRPSVCVG